MQGSFTRLSTETFYLPNSVLRLKLIFSGAVHGHLNFRDVNCPEKCNNKDYPYLMNS